MEVDIIPEVHQEFGCYHWFYISLYFIKEYGLDNMGEQVDVDMDTDKEEIEDVVLNDERERHWQIRFQDNNGGVDETKALLHAKK